MNITKNLVLAEKVEKAVSFHSRLKGLLGRKTMNANETLWIIRCSSIHTFFMNFSIDVVFVDHSLKVRARYENVKPWRLVSTVWGAKSVFEFAAGAIAKGKIEVGDQLNVVH
jgi:uncharacterized membrane protein (UPF0127 family)